MNRRYRSLAFRLTATAIVLCLGFAFFPVFKALFVECYARTGPGAVPLLIWFLDSDELTRACARGRIIDYREDSIGPLVSTLEDESVSVKTRGECARVLGRIGERIGEADDWIEPLRRAADDDSDFVSCQSLLALWRSTRDRDGVVPGLIRLLSKSSDGGVLHDSAQTLDEIGFEARAEAVRVLRQRRDAEPDDLQVKHALRLLGKE